MNRTDVLLEQLSDYQAADSLESRHVSEVMALLNGDHDPFSRTLFQPGHITASCFIVDGERILLHHHRRLERWLQMGGHVEEGESAAAAALREGREESGLADLELLGGIADVHVHLIPAGRGEPGHRHFDVRYVALTGRPAAIAIDRAESNDLVWFGLDEAAALMNATESTRVIAKIGRLLCRS